MTNEIIIRRRWDSGGNWLTLALASNPEASYQKVLASWPVWSVRALATLLSGWADEGIEVDPSSRNLKVAQIGKDSGGHGVYSVSPITPVGTTSAPNEHWIAVVQAVLDAHRR
jgi:hypothetical protein